MKCSMAVVLIITDVPVLPLKKKNIVLFPVNLIISGIMIPIKPIIRHNRQDNTCYKTKKREKP